MTTTLVLGGTRSGKSRFAQSLLDSEHPVTFVAPGPMQTANDSEWADRVSRHQRQRPAHWSTVEAIDITRAVLHARGPALIDCLGTWVTALIDQEELWEDREAALALVDERTAEFVALWTHAPFDLVAVSNEVGMSLVPPTPSGRLFQDALGRVNAAVSAASEQVYLVLAGRRLDLSSAPLVPRSSA